MWLQQLSPGGLGQADQRGRGGGMGLTVLHFPTGPLLEGKVFQEPGNVQGRAGCLPAQLQREVGASLP